MKNRFTLFALLLIFFSGIRAQLADGSTAPDFTATDINGNTWNLYEILNAGKPVIMDISATWCGPCWSYHETHALKDLYNQYGPDGTDELMVLFIEGDNSTGSNELNGSGNTQGDWVSGTPYPIIDDASIASLYQISYYPTVYMICPDRKVEEVGTISASQLYAKASACPEISLNAEFNASATTINQGQSVTFTDVSSGNPTSWSWTFEGGTPSTSTEQNPTVTYNSIGTFNVTLTVNDVVGDSDTESKTDYINVVEPTICDGGATNTSYEYISNFTCGSINNNSTTQTGGYADYTSQSTDIEEGTSASFSVSIGTPYQSDQTLIWVDWNGDLDFDDAGEAVHTSEISTGPHSGTIAVPMGTTAGSKTMRIRMEDSANSPVGTPCGDSKYGEVEDYTINVIASTILSDDASLNDLQSSGTTVDNFSGTNFTYNIELPYGTTDVPIVVATPTDDGATSSITYAGGLPGTTTITVTAEDGTTTTTYTINYTVAGKSLMLKDENGNDVTSAEFTVYGIPSDDEIIAHAGVTNIGNKTISVKVKKEVISEVSGSSNVFCWVNCFLPNTQTSPTSVDMAPGDENTDDFSGHYMCNGNPGITSVKYTFFDMNNEVDDAEVVIHYNVVATNVNETDQALTLYPVPANDILYLSGTEVFNGDFQVKIIDAHGRVCLVEQVSGAMLSTINISALAEGSYIVQCANSNTQINLSFIINR